MLDYHFVTERLAVGGAIRTAQNMQELAAAGITHIVNVQKEFDDSTIQGDSGIEVLWNGCEDDFLPKTSEWFWTGVRFTLAALADPNAKVLFHCAAGIHRSPLMLLAVLRVLGHERREAMEMISDARPQANFPPIYTMSVEDFMREYVASTRSS